MMAKIKYTHRHCCDEMNFHLSAGEIAVCHLPEFREYSILYLDGGSSSQLINYCPWCGTRLPKSLRDEWFDEVFALGLEPDDPKLPERYKSDEWYRNKGK